MKINIQDISNSIILEIIQLNHTIDVKAIIQASIYIVILECFSFFNQIYNNKFHRIPLQIYPHIITIGLNHPEVVANQLQLELISIQDTFHQVKIAHKQCQSSCKKVTSKFTGYKVYIQYGIVYFNKK